MPEPGNPQSLNRYAYCMNNPVRYTDPSGHWTPETTNPSKEQVLLAPSIGRIGVVFTSPYAGELRKQTLHRTAVILAKQVTTDPVAASLGQGITAAEAMMATVYQGVRLSRNDTSVFMETVNPILSGHIMNWPESIRTRNIQDEADPHHVGYEGSLGFRKKYRDPDPTNHQVHHFWFYVQVAYEAGPAIANLGNLRHETLDPGRSWADFALANAGANLGSNLRWCMRPQEVPDWLRLYIRLPVGIP